MIRTLCSLAVLTLLTLLTRQSLGETPATQPANPAAVDSTTNTTQPAINATDAAPTGHLPHIQIDAIHRQLRIECTALGVQAPLEFFCVQAGGPEHESVLRTPARPSDIHFALLALGLTPGEPAHLVADTDTWVSPTGPAISVRCRWFAPNGKPMDVPAYQMMRSIKTHTAMPPTEWVFDGSRVMRSGQYAADETGYVVSIVNFDLTMIDVPQLASNANETLEWERNPAFCPPKGSPVTMVLSPLTTAATRPAQSQPSSNFNPGPGLHPTPQAPSYGP